MSKVITNSFTLTALRDGSNYHGVIKLRDDNNPLLQFINTSDNSIFPSWEGNDATKVPEFYLEVRDQTGALVPYTGEEVYYGGDSADGRYTTKTNEKIEVNGVTMPYYKFKANPASPSNTDDDFFYMKANITVSSGVVVPITSDIRTVQIRATSGGAAYLMEVSSKNIEKNETEGFVRARIHNSNSVSQSVDDFNYSWYNITGSEPIEIQSGDAGYTIAQNQLTVHKDKINGHDTFMCIAKKKAEPNKDMEVRGTGGISDFSDPYTCELHITNDKGSAGTVIRKGETYTVTPKVYQTKNDSNGNPIKEEMNADVTLSFFNNNGVLTSWDGNDGNKGTYTLSYDTVVNTFGGQVRIDVSEITFN